MNIQLEKLEIHNNLNPKIWNSDATLKKDVRQHILDIVEEFIKNLDIEINVSDIELVGSNASYNYNKHSDIDVHIISNFESIGQPESLVSAAVNALKANFNKSYDISIKGINVELYVDDVKSSNISNGVYSVLHNMWIKKPQPIDPSVTEIDLEPELSQIYKSINSVLESDSIEDTQAMIDKLYVLRRQSLMSDGEYGKGNQIFKEVRNSGLLDGLKNRLIKLKSQELTLENTNTDDNHLLESIIRHMSK